MPSWSEAREIAAKLTPDEHWTSDEDREPFTFTATAIGPEAIIVALERSFPQCECRASVYPENGIILDLPQALDRPHTPSGEWSFSGQFEYAGYVNHDNEQWGTGEFLPDVNVAIDRALAVHLDVCGDYRAKAGYCVHCCVPAGEHVSEGFPERHPFACPKFLFGRWANPAAAPHPASDSHCMRQRKRELYEDPAQLAHHPEVHDMLLTDLLDPLTQVQLRAWHGDEWLQARLQDFPRP